MFLIMETKNNEFYKSTWFIILMLVVFFPVGIFLMWKYTNWNKNLKIGISVFFAIMFVFVGIDSITPREIPNVINQNISSATDTLEEVGFSNITLKDKDGNDTYSYRISDDNVIIEQKPKAGEKVTTDSKIELVVRDLGKEKEEKVRKEKEEVEKQIKSLINKDLETAITKATELQFTVKLYSATDESVSMDDSISKSDYVNWVVTKIKKNDYDKKKVSFVVSTKEAIALEQESKRIEVTLKSKISSTDAFIAMEKYGKAKYPYGFKLHYIMGVIASTPKDDSTWFLKANCDITNAFGATKSTVCEANVTINGSSISIPYFYAY